MSQQLDNNAGSCSPGFNFCEFCLKSILFLKRKLKMKEQTQTINTNEGPMEVFLALPDKAGPGPAVIVLQEAFGVNSHIRDVCKRFAQEGYVAAAPELFHRQGKNLTFGYGDFQKIRPMLDEVTNARLLKDVKTTFQFLADHPKVESQKISAVGFCMGGFVATLAALNLPLFKTAGFYAGAMVHERPGVGLKPLINEFDRLKAPLLLLFGDKDQGIPLEDVRVIGEKLDQSQKPHEVVVYPGAEHGFFCDERPSFNPKAAAEAWKKTLNWLK